MSELPTVTDFLGPGRDISSSSRDEAHAVKTFLGKTAEEAEVMFAENFLHHQEALMWMHAPAFRFYVRPALRYVVSERATGDVDAVMCLCEVIKWHLKQYASALAPIAGEVRVAVEKILTEFERVDGSGVDDGDLPSRIRAIAVAIDGA